MTGKYRFPRVALTLALALGLGLAAPAMADSVATEQQHGALTLTQLQHGQLSPKRLTSGQYENRGEYLMGRALGSPPPHLRMNALMDEMMGPTAADQMHIYLGERYLGVSTPPSSRSAPLYGLMGVMMSGYRGSPRSSATGTVTGSSGTRWPASNRTITSRSPARGRESPN